MHTVFCFVRVCFVCLGDLFGVFVGLGWGRGCCWCCFYGGFIVDVSFLYLF